MLYSLKFYSSLKELGNLFKMSKNLESELQNQPKHEEIGRGKEMREQRTKLITKNFFLDTSLFISQSRQLLKKTKTERREVTSDAWVSLTTVGKADSIPFSIAEPVPPRRESFVLLPLNNLISSTAWPWHHYEDGWGRGTGPRLGALGAGTPLAPELQSLSKFESKQNGQLPALTLYDFAEIL